MKSIQVVITAKEGTKEEVGIVARKIKDKIVCLLILSYP